MMRPAVILFMTLSAAAVAACGAPPGRPSGVLHAREKASQASNVLRSDYVGSDACAGCHAEVYAAWKLSPMHRMTRDVKTTDVSAPFDGRSLRLGEDEARLESHGGQRFLAISGPSSRTLFRITKVIGGRYREDFAGAQVELNEPFGAPLGAERVMPVSFLRFDGTLRYKGYSVMVRERTGLEPGVVWESACILCHNTAPQLVALYDELYGKNAPSYQGSASNELPVETAFKYVIDDPEGLRVALESELRVLGATGSLPLAPRASLAIAISSTRERWNEAALVELGVGCESCHGGSRRHARAPDRYRTSFGVESSFMHVETAAGSVLTPAQDINRGCAKCHTVLFSQYPYTWEGGARRDRPGGSTTNSGEARDFMLGACSSAMSCASCHDPHGEDSRQKLARLGQVDGNAVCTKCHAGLSSAASLRAHTHHGAQSAGSACLSCHMPKKNMGLAYELTRYHRIGSPTDEARVLGDRPLECALCHADRSVDQIVSTMETWWGKRFDRGALRALYGSDLRKNVVRLTLLGGKPHEQVVAADAAARLMAKGSRRQTEDAARRQAGAQAMARGALGDAAGRAIADAGSRGGGDPAGDQEEAARRAVVDNVTDGIVALLGSEYPLVRYFAKHSLERYLGVQLDLDMSLTGSELVAAGRTATARYRTPATEGRDQ